MPSPALPSHLSHKSSLVLLPPSPITKPIETLRRKHDKQFYRWPPHVNLIYPFLASPSNATDAENRLHSQDIKALNNKQQTNPSTPKRSSSNAPQLRDDIRSRIYGAVRNIQPFSISLRADPPGKFVHDTRSATVWLNPSDQLTELNSTASGDQNLAGTLSHLQAALQSEFSEYDAHNRPFTPHLSVGQAAGARGAEELSKEVQVVVESFLRDGGDGDVGHGDAEKQKQRPRNKKEQEAPIGLVWHIDTVFVIERSGFNDRFKIIGAVKLGEI